MRTLIALAGAATLATTATADVIHVPADAPTIQAGIDQAADGDTVLVARGVYAEAIDLGGKAITLQSNGATIDATGLGTGVTIDDAEGPGTVVAGFTIVGGGGSDVLGDGVPRGGAMAILGASPTITSCLLNENTASTGGAMYVQGGAPLLDGCTFNQNHAASGLALGGALHAVGADLTLNNCGFFLNTAASGFNGSGGAIAAEAGSVLVLDECHLHANVAASHGGAIYSQSSHLTVIATPFHVNEATQGGAVSCLNGPYELISCLIFGSEAGTIGGAVHASHADGLIRGCDIAANTAGFNGGGLFSYASQTVVRGSRFTSNGSGDIGGGVSVLEGSGDYANCVFAENTAAGLGGGMLHMQTVASIANCTFYANHSEVAGGALYDHTGASTTIANSILRSNAPGQLDAAEGATTTVTWSNVEGGHDGEGNIDTDPLFLDPNDPDEPDLRLSAGSPSADAASNLGVPPDVTVDADGLARFADDPATADTGEGEAPIVDMGAFETQGCAADMNGDGMLNVLDFLAFQEAWQAGAPVADCDESGAYDVLDFLCYQALFVAGCGE